MNNTHIPDMSDEDLVLELSNRLSPILNQLEFKLHNEEPIEKDLIMCVLNDIQFDIHKLLEIYNIST